MALRKDGSSKRSASYTPYDSSNSFVKKMANKVTGLIGWRSQSQSSVISQNYDNLSNSTDEDNVSPTPKRIRVQSEEEDTLLRLMPSTSKGTNELCSPIQPINNIKVASTSNRNQCFIASTPANIFSSTSVQSSSKHKPQDSDGTVSHDNNDSANASLTVPQFSAVQRHNVTVPAISRDMPSQGTNVDLSRRTGSFSISNSRRPSFNVDLFSNSSRRLSTSVCESRDVTSLSPFYSARTMYGGASSLLPYGNSSLNRLRSASTSRLNIFSPRSQITIQPISPSPNNCNNDQETMSASARRILDTLEKYCSPVMDAKRIPVNELRRSSGLASQPTPSKGIKRKLPSLNQMTPSTADLLRIKRQEKMQDSISSARQVVGTVHQSTIAAAAEDSDSSSDSVDLDYSILKSDSNAANSGKYIGKARRKDEKNFDHSTLPPLKLPNAVLKITNLPKFDITETFTFSKPLLLENLEQNVTEDDGSESVTTISAAKNDSSSQTSSSAAFDVPPKTSTDDQRTSFRQLTESRNETACPAKSVPMPQFLVKPTLSKSDLVSSKLSTNSPPKTAAPPWTCKVCLLESTGERCSSCTSTRIENKKPIDLPKPPTDKVDSATSSLTSGWGDKFKPTSDTWECKECFVRNASAETKCVACTSPKPGAGVPTASPSSSSNDVWKNAAKPCSTSWSFGATAKDATNATEEASGGEKAKFLFGVDKVDGAPASVSNATKYDADNKTSTTASFGVDAVTSVVNSAVTTKPTFTFGFGNTSSSPVSSVKPSNDNPLTNNVPMFSFGDSVVKTAPADKSAVNSMPTFTFGNPNAKAASAATFSFGANKTSETTDAKSCNAVVMKNQLTDGLILKSEAEKTTDTKKNVSVFNDVSGIASKNPLLKSATESNDANLFKAPKTMSQFETASANKENGDDKGTTNSIFNSIGTESPPKKKNILFPSYSSPSSTPNVFGSNGFAKPEMSSSLTNSTTTPAASSSITNVFNSSFTSPVPNKPNNGLSLVPSFGNAAEQINANDSSKASKMFAHTNSFGASSSQLQQQSSGATFEGFGNPKLESPVTNNTAFNSTSVFNFGNSGSTTSQAVAGTAPPTTGGFAFNGPKVEDTGSPKIFFGSMTNANYAKNNTPVPVNATNDALQCASTPQFSFNPPTGNDQSKPVNSIFASPTPSMKDFSSNSNSLPMFANNVFGNASQPAPPTMNAPKKSGGFSFPSPSQFAAQSTNSFTGFGNASAENQDQNSLNSNAAPGTSPYIFGSANLTVPPRFNFSGGTAPAPTFSAQPTAINSTVSSGLPPRRIKKAVRRTAK